MSCQAEWVGPARRLRFYYKCPCLCTQQQHYNMLGTHLLQPSLLEDAHISWVIPACLAHDSSKPKSCSGAGLVFVPRSFPFIDQRSRDQILLQRWLMGGSDNLDVIPTSLGLGSSSQTARDPSCLPAARSSYSVFPVTRFAHASQDPSFR